MWPRDKFDRNMQLKLCLRDFVLWRVGVYDFFCLTIVRNYAQLNLHFAAAFLSLGLSRALILIFTNEKFSNK